MAITFDHSITTEIGATDAQDRMDVMTYNSSTSTYTNYLTKNIAFDYFSDTAIVGDMIYFGWTWEKWHDLKLNITTPLVADSITMVWEYIDYNGAWQTLSVTDNSNSFQNSGSQTVLFTPPAGWKYARINSQKGSWIRARITSVSNITEGGANGTVAVDAKDYTIQVTGTETLSSIYAENVSEGWGLITKAGSTHVFYCNFRIGDMSSTTTIFNMSQEVLQIGEHDTSTKNKYYYYNKFSFFAQHSGDTWNMGDSSGKNGCGFIYNCSQTGKSPYNYFRCYCNWYNSFISKRHGGYGEGGMKSGIKTFENCVFSPYNVFFLISVASGSSFKNCVVDIGTTGYWYVYTNRFSYDNIQLTVGAGILAQGCILSNTVFGSKKFNCYSSSNYLIDCSLDDADSQFNNSSGGGVSYGYLQYTVNVNVVDEEGNGLTANIKMVNSYGETVYENDGSMSEVLTVFKRTWADGSGGDITTENNNPFTITITKTGYQTYVQENVSINNTINWTVPLALQIPIVYNASQLSVSVDEPVLSISVNEPTISVEVNEPSISISVNEPSVTVSVNEPSITIS